jgi:hypothetical protein
VLGLPAIGCTIELVHARVVADESWIDKHGYLCWDNPAAGRTMEEHVPVLGQMGSSRIG